MITEPSSNQANSRNKKIQRTKKKMFEMKKKNNDMGKIDYVSMKKTISDKYFTHWQRMGCAGLLAWQRGWAPWAGQQGTHPQNSSVVPALRLALPSRWPLCPWLLLGRTPYWRTSCTSTSRSPSEAAYYNHLSRHKFSRATLSIDFLSLRFFLFLDKTTRKVECCDHQRWEKE